MNVIEFLNEERKIAKEEERLLEENVSKEREHLQNLRTNQKKNIARKIAFVDKIQTNIEQQKDEEKISVFIEKEKERISREKKQRRDAYIHKNRFFVTIVGIVLAAITFSGISLTNSIHHRQMLYDYNEAITMIMAGNYLDAKELLDENDVEDSEALLQYANLRIELSEYKGDIPGLLESTSCLDDITNEKVKAQSNAFKSDVVLANDIQNKINELDDSELYIDDDSKLISIGKDIDSLDGSVAVLLNKKKYSDATTVAQNIKNRTDVGNVILMIHSLGDVTLESEDELKSARSAYDKLSVSDQNIVRNYSTLVESEAEYAELVQEYIERKEAEEKAQLSRARPSGVSQNEEMVLRTPKGRKYHRRKCGGGNFYEVTLSEARNAGLEPCSKCY